MFVPEFSVKENLIFFSKIFGLDGDHEHYAEYMAKKFEVLNFFGTEAKNLSGGNQRKLCTAIAMIGKKPAIFLDESSAGVDPYSRRKLWKTIREKSNESALIVTTHSMEEAEALGTKMAIMVDGKFKCFGTA
jgi:ATP-binding cassette subfamily A (ABC1) protein 3